jgi:putative ABC transport system substrate-binding protein
LAICLCAAVSALAQDAARIPVVGLMRTGGAANNEPFATLFRDALAARGYVEGRNLRLDHRFADGDAQRYPEMAQALVKDRVGLIVVFSDPAARAAQRETQTIPIIAVLGDPIASGLIASLAKPGGNLTGISMFGSELAAKRLEILTEILPAAQRFGVLVDRANVPRERLQAVEDGARALGVKIQTVGVRSPADFAAAFDSLRAGGAEAVSILGSSLLFNYRNEVGALALADKLPAICDLPEMAAAGCLASYGPSWRELSGDLAELTDKILKGASPAELPARQPTKFELVVNLKTAKELGLTVPPSILARADEVIE